MKRIEEFGRHFCHVSNTYNVFDIFKIRQTSVSFVLWSYVKNRNDGQVLFAKNTFLGVFYTPPVGVLDWNEILRFRVTTSILKSFEKWFGVTTNSPTCTQNVHCCPWYFTFYMLSLLTKKHKSHQHFFCHQ